MLTETLQVFPGIPRSDASEFYALRQWFAKLGWNVGLATTVCTLVINNLGGWSPPDGLAQSLRSDDIKYDRVSGSEYTVAVIEHLKRCARTDLLDTYTMALESKESSSIIRAKRTSDSAIMGTLLMVKADSKLVQLMPGFSKTSSRGSIAAPVISPASNDRHSMLQGLVLLGARELKKQGVATVVLDKVSKALHHVLSHELVSNLMAVFFRSVTTRQSNTSTRWGSRLRTHLTKSVEIQHTGQCRPPADTMVNRGRTMGKFACTAPLPATDAMHVNMTHGEPASALTPDLPSSPEPPRHQHQVPLLTARSAY